MNANAVIPLEIRNSGIHRRGLFSNLTIPSGSEFYTAVPQAVTPENGPCIACVGFPSLEFELYMSDRFIDRINHSPEPNTRLDIEKFPPVLRSLRNIGPGEEITCDYRKTEPDSFLFRKKEKM